jgi:papilin
VDCEAEWYLGDWEACSQSCGNNGWQYRVIYCHQIFADGRRITVDDGNCTAVAERPAVKQTCNRFACPEWQAGPWSACSEKCGDAKQYRSVTCRSEKEGEEGKVEEILS